MGGLSYPYRSHIQIWGQTIKNCAVYRHFYGCFIKHAVTFLWIHCRQSIWLLFDLCLSSEHQTFKLKKFSHLTICGKKIYSLSLSNKKLWPSLLKRCKCPQLAKKGGHIYERVLLTFDIVCLYGKYEAAWSSHKGFVRPFSPISIII